MKTNNKQDNRIPIQNLFYMLCYAWNVLAIKDDDKVGITDYDNASNLLARVFSYGIGKLIRSGFHRSYVPMREELSLLKGKINIQESINHLSLQKNKMYCDYDEYSSNDTFNQILKYTISALVRDKRIDSMIRSDLKKQLTFFDSIDEIAPTKDNRQKLHFNRNNQIYKLLIQIAVMIYENQAIEETGADSVFADFFRETQMQKVYEMFILNFYSSHLDKKIYRVFAPKFQWQTCNVEDIWDDEEQAFSLMPELRTDIVIENKSANIQFIIDAKYYHNILVSSYQSEIEKFRRDHISQIYTYMDNSPFTGKKRGALMYPRVAYDVEQTVKVKPGRIFFKSLNLNRDWKEIETDLIEFATRAD